jgi:hypothetical protein
MDKDRIQKAVEFLKNDQIKNVSYDEKVMYLKSKLTEEELSEALTRVKGKVVQITDTTSSSSNAAQPSYTNSRNSSSSSVQEYRPQSSGGSKLLKALNIGAISAASSIGVSYMISNMKDKKEQEVVIKYVIS